MSQPLPQPLRVTKYIQIGLLVLVQFYIGFNFFTGLDSGSKSLQGLAIDSQDNSFMFVVMLALVFMVPRQPLVAGLLQIAGAGFIFMLSFDRTLKVVAIAILIGGALAIAASADKTKVPHSS